MKTKEIMRHLDRHGFVIITEDVDGHGDLRESTIARRNSLKDEYTVSTFGGQTAIWTREQVVSGLSLISNRIEEWR